MEPVIFTERPYAAVLENEFVKSHCTNCFRQNPTFSCPKFCGVAEYCDEKCSNDDSRWHGFECAAYRRYKETKRQPNVEARVRIVGRLLTRLRYDKGIASISDRFPAYAKERKYGDLLSHYDEIKKDPWSTMRMKAISNSFFEFYASTPLKDTPPTTVRITYCIFRINSFCITNDAATLGVGLYLNASRFNHSCRPTASARFVGNRIQIKARSHVHPDEYSTESRFDNLTVDYGTTMHASRGCYITLARQRVDSLKTRYFFRCLCQACADSTVALLEERAATAECQQCGLPYVWTRKGNLKPICGCEEWLPAKTARKEQRLLVELEKRWRSVMDETERCTDHWKVIDLCEPLLETAKRFWHNTENLRLAQLIERLVVAYGCPGPYSLTGEEECKIRAECFTALAQFYDRNDWGRELAQQFRECAELWKVHAYGWNGGCFATEETKCAAAATA